jgi:lactoylglutathione lyase
MTKSSSTLFDGFGVFIPVSNLKRSVEWYNSILGFTVIHDDAPEATVVRMYNTSVVFCLVKCEEVKTLEFPKNNYNVGQYFNFHTNDVTETHRRLSESGAKVGEIQSFDGMRGFHLLDPDGNLFGVVQ